MSQQKSTLLRLTRSALKAVDKARAELRLARRTGLCETELEKAIVSLNHADLATLHLEVKALEKK